MWEFWSYFYWSYCVCSCCFSIGDISSLSLYFLYSFAHITISVLQLRLFFLLGIFEYLYPSWHPPCLSIRIEGLGGRFCWRAPSDLSCNTLVVSMFNPTSSSSSITFGSFFKSFSIISPLQLLCSGLSSYLLLPQRPLWLTTNSSSISGGIFPNFSLAISTSEICR